MTSLPIEEEVTLLILQYLKEKNYLESVHSLEEESGVFFDVSHFDKKIRMNEFEEAEQYLSAFTTIDQDVHSKNLFKSIRTLKYIGALCRGENALAVDILLTELEFVRTDEAFYASLLNELTKAKTKTDVSISGPLECRFRDEKAKCLEQLKLISDSPLFKDKLQFPNFESCRLTKVLTNSLEFMRDLTNYRAPYELCCLSLCSHTTRSGIMKLMYTSSGSALLALFSNAVLKLLKWQADQSVTGEEASTNVQLKLAAPSGIVTINETVQANTEGAVPCFALSKDDSFVVSASGGKIHMHYKNDFKTMWALKSPAPAVASVAFHPKDNNVIAIGMDGSTIEVYNVLTDELISKLEGHQKRITGLAFSNVLDILISSGSDTQLCVWDIYRWEKRTSAFLKIPAEGTSNSNSDTKVQFHKDELSVLAVHETHLAVYEATELKVIRQFVPALTTRGITDATYSSDAKSIYMSFKDGRVAVLNSYTLSVRCFINPAAYLPSDPSSTRAYPVALAAHPRVPNRIAVGLSDGGIYFLEPLGSERAWRNLYN